MPVRLAVAYFLPLSAGWFYEALLVPTGSTSLVLPVSLLILLLSIAAWMSLGWARGRGAAGHAAAIAGLVAGQQGFLCAIEAPGFRNQCAPIEGGMVLLALGFPLALGCIAVGAAFRKRTGFAP